MKMKKRAYVRYSVNNRSAICYDKNDKKIIGNISNISKEGLQIIFNKIIDIDLKQIVFIGPKSTNTLKINQKYLAVDEEYNKTIIGVYIPDQKDKEDFQSNLNEIIK